MWQRLSYGWESTSVLPKHFSSLSLNSSSSCIFSGCICRQFACTGFARFSLSSPHFNLKFVRWAAVGGRMQIEGTQHFIQKLLHLLFGTILVEGNTQIVHDSFKPEVSQFEFAILTAWLQPPRTASVSFFYNSCGNCRSLSHEACCNNMFPGLGVN